MNVLVALKARYESVMKKREEKPRERRQFNMVIDKSLVFLVRFFAYKLGLPRYVVVEHLLQVGLYYLVRTMEDPGQWEVLHQHLIDKHLLGGEVPDSEDILRLGESNYMREFLVHVRGIVANIKALERALQSSDGIIFGRDEIDKCKKELNKSIAKLIVWLKIFNLEEEVQRETYDSPDEA